jgi:hypothetical protein
MRQSLFQKHYSLNLFKLLVTILGLSFIHVFVISVQAQSPDKILKQSLKAMGGEKAIKNIKSRQAKGKITRMSDGTSGSYQASAMQPSYYTDSFDINGFEVAVGYNGKSGWTRDSKDGLRTLTGKSIRDFQVEAAYRNTRWLNYKNEKSKLAYSGTAAINGKQTSIVTLTTIKNAKVKMYFDAATNLLIREEVPADGVNKTFDYSDFRAVDGVLEPFTINIAIGDERYEIKLDQVVHNPSLAVSVFDFPKISNEPLPDIQALLDQVGKNEDRIEELLEQYSYTETEIEREIGKDGVMREKESKSYEWTFYKGHRLRRLVAENRKPLSEDNAEKELKRIEKQIKEIEKDEAEKAKKRQKENASGSDEGQRISIADLLRASRLVNPRRERFRGRDVIVFDFEPMPGYKPKKDYEKLFGKTAGAMWIDPNDKQVVRAEARLLEAFKVAGGLLASLKKGSAFVLEQERVNDEIWLPSLAEINIAAKVFLFKGIEVNKLITYGDYKKFMTDVDKDVKIKDPAGEGKKP